MSVLRYVEISARELKHGDYIVVGNPEHARKAHISALEITDRVVRFTQKVKYEPAIDKVIPTSTRLWRVIGDAPLLPRGYKVSKWISLRTSIVGECELPVRGALIDVILYDYTGRDGVLASECKWAPTMHADSVIAWRYHL